METTTRQAILSSVPTQPDSGIIKQQLAALVEQQQEKVFVLDDDPTGTQTVHGVPVYTDWQSELLQEAFHETGPLVYILTNTRAMPAAEAKMVIREIMRNLCNTSRSLSRSFSVILRSDSTLRGHYPLENELVRNTMEQSSGLRYDGEILIPFFGEGGRLTWQDIHWVEVGGVLYPVGQTEFAKDNTFGFGHSDLKQWIEEKTEGRVRSDEVVSISLDAIRLGSHQRVTHLLSRESEYRHYIVNAVDYADLYTFTLGLLAAEQHGRRFLIRSAASFVKVRANISDQPLLSRDAVVSRSELGGLVVVGSHVAKTTHQLKLACGLPGVNPIELDVARLLTGERDEEIIRAADLCSRAISEGQTALLFTSREVQRAVAGISDANLAISRQVSQALVEVVRRLSTAPGFLIAKGGITASDIGTKALGVKRAVAAGQIWPGIPVWHTPESSLFGGLPFIIFPGNVGDESTLKDIIQELHNGG